MKDKEHKVEDRGVSFGPGFRHSFPAEKGGRTQTMAQSLTHVLKILLETNN